MILLSQATTAPRIRRTEHARVVNSALSPWLAVLPSPFVGPVPPTTLGQTASRPPPLDTPHKTTQRSHRLH